MTAALNHAPEVHDEVTEPREPTHVGTPPTREPGPTYAALFVRCRELQTSVNTLRRMLREARDEIGNYAGRLTLSQGTAASYSRRNDDLKTMLASRNGEIELLGETIHGMQEQLDELRERTSSADTKRMRRPATHPDDSKTTRPFKVEVPTLAREVDDEYVEMVVDDPEEPDVPSAAWGDGTPTPHEACVPMSEESGPKVHIRGGW